MVLTAADLAYMRSAINELLPDTCNICTITHTPNGMGGCTDTRATIGTAIACRLDMQSGREPTVGGAVQQFTGYTLSLPYDTTIGITNLVEINSADYSVTSINDGQSWIAVKRVTLEAL